MGAAKVAAESVAGVFSEIRRVAGKLLQSPKSIVLQEDLQHAEMEFKFRQEQLEDTAANVGEIQKMRAAIKHMLSLETLERALKNTMLVNGTDELVAARINDMEDDIRIAIAHVRALGGKVEIPCPHNCSGHGKCGADGVCVCEAEYTTKDCSIVRCPNDCSGHGACNGGVCDCDTWWTGPYCGRRDQSKCSKVCWGRCMKRGGMGEPDEAGKSSVVNCVRECMSSDECTKPIYTDGKKSVPPFETMTQANRNVERRPAEWDPNYEDAKAKADLLKGNDGSRPHINVEREPGK
jgi:hypothetical protein